MFMKVSTGESWMEFKERNMLKVDSGTIKFSVRSAVLASKNERVLASESTATGSIETFRIFDVEGKLLKIVGAEGAAIY